jgi:hypothetical protein
MISQAAREAREAAGRSPPLERSADAAFVSATPLSIDPLNETGRHGILHDSNAQDTIVLQHLSRGIARLLKRGIW